MSETPKQPWEVLPPTDALLTEVTLGTKWREGERRFGYGSQNAEGKKLEMNLGTAAAPDEGVKPAAVFSRVLKVAEANFEGDGAGNLGAIRATAVAVAGSQGQALGGVFSAVTEATNEGAHSLSDGIGAYALGISRGASTRTGMGIFIIGRREVETGRAVGTEMVVDNETAAAEEYTGVLPNTLVAHIHAFGTANSAAGLVFNKPATTTAQIHTAIAQTTSTLVTNAFIRDDGTAPYSIRIRGAHSKLALAIEAGAGSLGIGEAELSGAGILLEVNPGETSTDPLVSFGSGKNINMSMLPVKSGNGQLKCFIANGNNQFVTGSANGTVGFNWTPANQFMLGAAGKNAQFKVSELGVGIGVKAISLGSGKGVLFISNAEEAPTANPAEGSVIYGVAGDLRARSSSGAVSSVAGSAGRTEIAALTEVIEIEHKLGVEPGNIQLTYEGAEAIFPVLQVTAKSATKFTVKRSISTKVGFINWRCWVV